MSKDSRAAAESAAGTPLRMARCELAGSALGTKSTWEVMLQKIVLSFLHSISCVTPFF